MSDRILIEARKHHACKGGKGRGCAACGDTGEAGIAFVRKLRDLGYEDDMRMKGQDEDQDKVIDYFAEACWGEGEKAGQVVTVLQHVVDRAAMDTVFRLGGGTDALFNWLCTQERLHCRFRRNV